MVSKPFFFGVNIVRSILAVARLGAGGCTPHMIECAAPGALDFKVAGAALCQQLVAMTTTDLSFFPHWLMFPGLPRKFHHDRPCPVPRGQTQADTLHEGQNLMWGRGAAVLRRAGGGVLAPPPLSRLHRSAPQPTLPEKGALGAIFPPLCDFQ